MTRITAFAPAKINLGLEILGRRSDGYHEISTVFQTIDLCDSIEISASDRLTVRSNPPFESEANLAFKAAASLRNAVNIAQGAAIRIEKRIPISAGLGGGSSDAAATLRALAKLWETNTPESEMCKLGLSLGSDVPFLLYGGTMIGRGRGEILARLATPFESWVVLAIPFMTLQNKTQSMFRSLAATDFSDGSAVAEISRQIEAGEKFDTPSIPNAFTRAIYETNPELRQFPSEFANIGAPGVAISGAGPTHYTLVNQEIEAFRIAERLEQRFRGSARIVACKTLAYTPLPVRDNR